MARLPTARACLERYLDWHKGEHPARTGKARSELKRFIAQFGNGLIDMLKPFEIEKYKRHRLVEDKAAPETVGKEVRRLKAAFLHGMGWKELDVNPMDGFKVPRDLRSVSVRFHDRAAVRKLYQANPTRAPLWLFPVHTGCATPNCSA